jgi:hypothetical protein
MCKGRKCLNRESPLARSASRGLARLLVLIGGCEISFCSCLLTADSDNARAFFVFLASITLFAAAFFMKSAAAQVVIPYGDNGDYDSDFEKYLVVAVSLAALIFAVWRYWGSRR